MKWMVLVIALTLVNCKSKEGVATMNAKNNENTISIQQWSGGAPGSGSGYLIDFEKAFFDEKPSKVYFKGSWTDKVSIHPDKPNWYRVRLNNQKGDVVMHSDSSKEVVNEIPFPENAVRKVDDGDVAVLVGDLWIIVNNVPVKEPLFYPSAPPRQQ